MTWKLIGFISIGSVTDMIAIKSIANFGMPMVFYMTVVGSTTIFDIGGSTKGLVTEVEQTEMSSGFCLDFFGHSALTIFTARYVPDTNKVTLYDVNTKVAKEISIHIE